MASYNKVMIMGNITRDIELRYTPKQTAVSDIAVACNRVRMGENGQKIEEVTFVDVTLWGKTAELAKQYLSKGSPVFIEGRLQTDSWVDKETGKNRSKLKVVADNLQFLPSGNKGGGGGNYQQNQGQGQQQQQQGYAQPQQQQQQQSNHQAPPQQQQPPQQQGGSPASNMPNFVEDDDDIPF